MNVSLREFLTGGQLGDIGIGTNRDHIHSVFGDPPIWAGARTLDIATIWRFGAVQFNLDSEFNVETIHLFYERNLQDQPDSLTLDFLPLHLAESDIGDMVFLSGLTRHLSKHGVEFAMGKNDLNQDVAFTGRDAVTTFVLHTDYNASMQAERPIHLAEPVVVRSTVFAAQGRPPWFFR